MPRFIVKSQIESDKVYPPGSEIELTMEEALDLSDALVNPPRPPAPKDRNMARALESQRNRPEGHLQDWKRDSDAIRANAALDKQLAVKKEEPVKKEESKEEPAKKEETTDEKK